MVEKLPITVIVHVKNEEINLPYTLENVITKFDQVVVVDSDSTDDTQNIAYGYGCDVISRPCTRKTLVAQRNWALDTIEFRNEWCFVLDGDEVIEEELIIEMASIDLDKTEYDAYSMRWRNIFLGKWIRHSSFYPTWSIRLFKHEVVRYEERAVNAHPFVRKGKLGRLKGHFQNFDRRGLKFYFDRISPFSDLESTAQKAESEALYKSLLKIQLRTRIGRRRLLKLIFNILPFRPFLIFIYLFILRLGFLDGRTGFIYIILKVIQEWLTKEMIRTKKQL